MRESSYILTPREYSEYLQMYPNLSSTWWEWCTGRYSREFSLKNREKNLNSTPTTQSLLSNQSQSQSQPKVCYDDSYLYKGGSFQHLYRGKNEFGLDLGLLFYDYQESNTKLLNCLGNSQINRINNCNSDDSSSMGIEKFDLDFEDAQNDSKLLRDFSHLSSNKNIKRVGAGNTANTNKIQKNDDSANLMNESDEHEGKPQSQGIHISFSSSDEDSGDDWC
jgi:hypothetical protein